MTEQSTPLFWSALGGAVRGASVHLLIHPIEVVKIRQHSQTRPTTAYRVARALLQREGCGAFFGGLSHQLLKSTLRQSWCWPMITHMPPLLDRVGMESMHQQLLTGISIATVDALVTTPLERARIWGALDRSRGLRHLYVGGWHGLAAYWRKRTINMTTFLLAQEHLRNRCIQRKGEARLSNLTIIGFQVALLVSVVSAPFDILNTLRQAGPLASTQRIAWRQARRYFRGWPLSFLTLAVHNVASVLLIHHLRSE